jgi:hypothetical protein
MIFKKKLEVMNINELHNQNWWILTKSNIHPLLVNISH